MEYKEFINKLEEILHDFETPDYQKFIYSLAMKEKSYNREFFIDVLQGVLGRSEVTINTATNDELNDTLIDEIQNLLDRIDADEFEGQWGWDDDINKERMFGDESWADESDELFQRARFLALGGNYKIAVEAYELLLKIVEKDNLPCVVSPEETIDTDLEEARALFLHSLYMNTKHDDRPFVVFEAISFFKYSFQNSFSLMKMIQANSEELDDFNEFLDLWILFLANRQEVYADRLLREAIIIKGGTDAIGDFARENYKNHPQAYLDWIEELEIKNTDSKEIIQICIEALEKLPCSLNMRENIAKSLIKASETISDIELMYKGYQEAFYAKPCVRNFIYWLEFSEKNKYDCKSVLKTSIEHVQNLLEDRSEYSSAIHSNIMNSDMKGFLLNILLLLDGNIQKSYDLSKECDPFGWSYGSNCATFTIPYLLILLSNNKFTYSRNIETMWSGTLLKVSGFFEKTSFVEILDKNVRNAINEVILSPELKEIIKIWCKDMVIKRVAYIVSNQRRGAYDRAALLLCAYAEMIGNTEDTELALVFVNSIRSRFPKHRNFIADVERRLKDCSFN